MKSFDIDDAITKLDQISTKRAKILFDHKIKSVQDLIYYFRTSKVKIAKS